MFYEDQIPHFSGFSRSDSSGQEETFGWWYVKVGLVVLGVIGAAVLLIL